MSAAEVHDNMEERILKAARSLFIEKGFEETSMSDIAANVGINRPGLHYYFRTKERMFHAVFEDIILSIVPKVFTILMEYIQLASEGVQTSLTAQSIGVAALRSSSSQRMHFFSSMVFSNLIVLRFAARLADYLSPPGEVEAGGVCGVPRRVVRMVLDAVGELQQRVAV